MGKYTNDAKELLHLVGGEEKTLLQYHIVSHE